MGDKFDSAVLNTIPAQPAAGDVWVEVNLTAQVQAWVNGGEANYGIMLIPTQIILDSSGNELFRHEGFMSREEMAAQLIELGYDPSSPMD